MNKIKKRQHAKRPGALPGDQLEQLLECALTGALAFYILKKSKTPVSRVMRDLTDIQFNAARLVGFILKLKRQPVSQVNLEGSLKGALSFIPFAGAAKFCATTATRPAPPAPFVHGASQERLR